MPRAVPPFTVKKLKNVLIKLKGDITNVQFYEPDDYDLNIIIEKIEQALEVQ